MKYILSVLLLSLLVSFTALAQVTISAPRRIRFNFIKKDSINLALNEDYDMIEDSCAQITRYGHLNMQKRIFTGKIKDVSRLSPTLVLTEGNYNDAGLKNGYFTTCFLDGKLQAKGIFKNGQYDGPWEVYYDNDKPRLKFTVADGVTTITDAWDTDGKKTVDNGKGTYRASVGSIYWKGKLLNGHPDGTWRAIKTDDATETDLATESYKKGEFKNGSGRFGDYTDKARVVMIPLDMLPFTNAERVRISSVPCNGTKRKHMVNAQYSNGRDSFSEEIKMAVGPVISKYDIKSYENDIVISGYVSETGSLVALVNDSPFQEELARGISQKLARLPNLVPASVDGKPVKQKITFKFSFTKGMYSFSYRFLPLEVK